MKQLELNFDNKPITEPTKKEVEKRIATFGDPKSNGAWKNFVDENKKAREETAVERIDRIKYEFNETEKRPPHLDNKKIYSFEDRFKKDANNINDRHRYPTQSTPEQFGKLAERIERQRQMTGGPNTWELMKKTATTTPEKNEIKRILNKEYYKQGPKNMDPEDLKYIGKHKSQIVYPEIVVPHIETNLINKPTPPPEPQIPIEQTIKVLADKRLNREQKVWDQKHGRSGITDLLRPK